MEEKEIKKPPFWLSFQLFLFMMLIIQNLLALMNNLNGYWWDRINLVPIHNFLIAWVIDFTAYSYSLIAIYKALQCKPYSIVMLKFSTIYLFFQLLFRSLNHWDGIIPLLPLFYVPAIIFCIAFLFYLFRSKKLKNYLPVSKRVFGKFGLWGIGIYLAVVVQYVCLAAPNIIRENKSVPVDSSLVETKEGEFTDGLTIIKPLSTWKVDSIYGNKEEGIIFSFRCKNDIVSATAFHGICNNRLDFCTIMSDFYTMYFPDSIAIKEVAYNDTLINNSLCYSNTYEINSSKDNSIFWTFTAMVDKESYKIQALSYIEKGGYHKSIQESMEFMQHIVFDLKQRLVVHESID